MLRTLPFLLLAGLGACQRNALAETSPLPDPPTKKSAFRPSSVVNARMARGALWALKAQVRNCLHNIANANTTAYKRRRLHFADLPYTTFKAPGIDTATGTPNPTGTQLGTGTTLASTTIDFQTGVLEGTYRNLDVAITGAGFFQLLLPDGNTGYTRDGHFQIDRDGNLVTTEGHKLLPFITLPQDVIHIGIGKDGKFQITQASSAGVTSTLGTLQLARFVNPSGLNPRGGNVYGPSEASGQPIIDDPGKNGLGELQENFLEQSNVDVDDELMRLEVAERQHEALSRTLHALVIRPSLAISR